MKRISVEEAKKLNLPTIHLTESYCWCEASGGKISLQYQHRSFRLEKSDHICNYRHYHLALLKDGSISFNAIQPDWLFLSLDEHLNLKHEEDRETYVKVKDDSSFLIDVKGQYFILVDWKWDKKECPFVTGRKKIDING